MGTRKHGRRLRRTAALLGTAAVTVTVLATAAAPALGTSPGAAERWNQAFSAPALAGGWTGGDIGASFTDARGGTWLLYGDTSLRTPTGATRWAPSSALRFPAGTLKAQRVTYRDSAGRPLDTPLPGGTEGKYWPSSVAADPRTPNRFIVSASHVTITGQDMWGFAVDGAGLFDVTVDPAQATLTVHDHVTTPQAGRGKTIQWGSALASATSTLYIFGSREVPGSLGKDIYLAVAPIATWQNTATWRYATTMGTSKRLRDARPVIGAEAGLPHTFSVLAHPAGHGWLLIAKQHEGLGEHVVAAAAARPRGPWTTPTPLFDAAPEGDIWQYAALAHPGIAVAPGRLLVSTSRNVIAADAASRIAREPRLYRPTFTNVPVASLPSS